MGSRVIYRIFSAIKHALNFITVKNKWYLPFSSKLSLLKWRKNCEAWMHWTVVAIPPDLLYSLRSANVLPGGQVLQVGNPCCNMCLVLLWILGFYSKSCNFRLFSWQRGITELVLVLIRVSVVQNVLDVSQNSRIPTDWKWKNNSRHFCSTLELAIADPCVNKSTSWVIIFRGELE